MECASGDEAQVDFGKGAVHSSQRQEEAAAPFSGLCSAIRARYSEGVWRQDTETFVRILENAFHHFGGMPRTLIVDNLKAAVLQADGFDADQNPKIGTGRNRPARDR